MYAQLHALLIADILFLSFNRQRQTAIVVGTIGFPQQITDDRLSFTRQRGLSVEHEMSNAFLRSIVLVRNGPERKMVASSDVSNRYFSCDESIF